MPDPTDDRRDRLRASYDDLSRAASSLSAAVDAFKTHLAEQETALNDARSADALRRLEAEIARLEAQHAADMRQVEAAADESAQAATLLEAERDEANRVRAAVEKRLAAAEAERDAARATLDAERHAADADLQRLKADVAVARAERDAARAEASAPRSGQSAAPPAAGPTVQPVGSATVKVVPPAAKARATPDAVPPEPVAPSDPAPSAMGETIAGAFRAWCAAASAVVGKVGFFAEALRQVMPGAAASAVYRDANSQAQPITFGLGGSSPVEYWLVAAEGRHWLFPQPLSPGQFRELAPCFDGTATPAALAAVRPAEVRSSGDRFELGQRGRVA